MRSLFFTILLPQSEEANYFIRGHHGCSRFPSLPFTRLEMIVSRLVESDFSLGSATQSTTPTPNVTTLRSYYRASYCELKRGHP